MYIFCFSKYRILPQWQAWRLTGLLTSDHGLSSVSVPNTGNTLFLAQEQPPWLRLLYQLMTCGQRFCNCVVYGAQKSDKSLVLCLLTCNLNIFVHELSNVLDLTQWHFAIINTKIYWKLQKYNSIIVSGGSAIDNNMTHCLIVWNRHQGMWVKQVTALSFLVNLNMTVNKSDKLYCN